SVAGAVEQGVEDRVAVKARQAAPDDAPTPVDQRAERAVADDSQRKRSFRRRGESGRVAHARLRAGPPSTAPRSQSRSASGDSHRWVASVSPGPTLIETPPSS